MQKDISIDKAAISRAVRSPLEAYYKEVEAAGYNGTTERPGTWDEDEALFKALVKSKYVAQHLDWFYVLELIYSVLDNNPPLKAADFAEKLEELIVATASHRDYLAIFPLSFRPVTNFGLRSMQTAVVKRKVVGEFTISPSAPTVRSLNRITSKHGFPKLDDSDFQHAMRTSNEALSRAMVVTFEIHGAEDQLRWNADLKFTYFRRLVEVFGVLFGSARSGFVAGTSVNHFFLLNKTTAELRRFPEVRRCHLRPQRQ